MLEKKNKRVKLSEVDEYVAFQSAFGWTLQEKDQLRPDQTILVKMRRDSKLFSNYGEIKQLEKDYEAIKRPYPLLAIIFGVIGGALLPFYFIFKGYIIAYVCLYLALTFFLITFYALFVFILLMFRRKRVLEKVLEYAANKSGVNKDWPTARNIAPKEKDTWTIRYKVRRKI